MEKEEALELIQENLPDIIQKQSEIFDKLGRRDEVIANQVIKNREFIVELFKQDDKIIDSLKLTESYLNFLKKCIDEISEQLNKAGIIIKENFKETESRLNQLELK